MLSPWHTIIEMFLFLGGRVGVGGVGADDRIS